MEVGSAPRPAFIVNRVWSDARSLGGPVCLSGERITLSFSFPYNTRREIIRCCGRRLLINSISSWFRLIFQVRMKIPFHYMILFAIYWTVCDGSYEKWWRASRHHQQQQLSAAKWVNLGLMRRVMIILWLLLLLTVLCFLADDCIRS